MFAVSGTWPVDGTLASDQLAHVADTVRAQDGFVRGYWAQDSSDTTKAHAFVVFEDQQSALAMADGIRAAIPAASVTVLEVLATA